MSLAVVDASALTAFYSAEGEGRDVIAKRLASGAALYAPAHLDVEVASALRGLARHSAALERISVGALRHLAGFPIRRTPLAPLLDRIWELRANVTAYDAAYVALAERIGAPLITCDAQLAGASGPRCAFELIA